MNRQGRRCDGCGRPVGGKPGIIVSDNIFCSLVCKRLFPSAVRRRMIVHYRQMANDASAWIAKSLDWHRTHPDEEPVDMEALRLVERGARDIVEALRAWAPIPERALRMIHAAIIQPEH